MGLVSPQIFHPCLEPKRGSYAAAFLHRMSSKEWMHYSITEVNPCTATKFIVLRLLAVLGATLATIYDLRVWLTSTCHVIRKEGLKAHLSHLISILAFPILSLITLPLGKMQFTMNSSLWFPSHRFSYDSAQGMLKKFLNQFSFRLKEIKTEENSKSTTTITVFGNDRSSETDYEGKVAEIFSKQIIDEIRKTFNELHSKGKVEIILKEGTYSEVLLKDEDGHYKSICENLFIFTVHKFDEENIDIFLSVKDISNANAKRVPLMLPFVLTNTSVESRDKRSSLNKNNRTSAFYRKQIDLGNFSKKILKNVTALKEPLSKISIGFSIDLSEPGKKVKKV